MAGALLLTGTIVRAIEGLFLAKMVSDPQSPQVLEHKNRSSLFRPLLSFQAMGRNWDGFLGNKVFNATRARSSFHQQSA